LQARQQQLNILASAGSASEHAKLDIPGWHWAVFVSFVLAVIVFDVAVLHRKDKDVTIKQAAVQTLAWIALGVTVGFVIWGIYGADGGAEYFSGYVIEKSLSIDNVFVWSIILSYFAIPDKYQHRVLFWGIFGALILRAAFIFAGIGLIEKFEFSLILLGAFLLWTGWKVGMGGEDDEFDPDKSKLITYVRKVVPVSEHLHGHSLFTHENGKRVATMLFIALCAVEITDVFFAVDSVPAILAVARDPFIVFASNAMAILGLRALYFVFDALKDKFTLLNKGLGIILAAVGVKMIIGPEKILGINWFGIHVNTWLSLAFILTTLAAFIIASLRVGAVVEGVEPDAIVDTMH
jgi:tellurite resistance protein TerC